jgi:predicted amidohydrolase
MENRLFFAEVNRVGTQEELRFRGQSCVAGPAGDLLARSEGTCEEIVRATMRGDAMLEQRAIFPDFRDRRPEHYGLLSEPYERTH